MGMTGETNPLTSFDPETFAICLRRLHPWIANYNDLVMFLMKCNMDIKFVGSGEAAKAFVFYVTDYITKPIISIHAGLAALSHAILTTNAKFPELSSLASSGAATYTGAMTSTVNTMMGFQEISHPQVMSYLIGGGDHYTSEKFVVLWWAGVLRYVNKYFAATDVSQNSPPDLAEVVEADVSLSLGDGTISASNQLMDYVFRCETEIINEMCLYDFIGRVVKRQIVKRVSPEVGVWPGQFSDDEHPQYSSHFQVLRRGGRRFIPVLVGPKIHRSDRSEEEKELWAQAVVVLFKPWRRPADLKAPDETWLDVASHLIGELEPWMRSVIRNMNVLSECRDARREHPRPGKRDTTAVVTSELLDDLLEEDGRVIADEISPYGALEDPGDEEVGYEPVGESVVKSLVGEGSLVGLRLCVTDDGRTLAPYNAGTMEEVDEVDVPLIRSCTQAMNVLKKKRRPERSDREDGGDRKRRLLDFAPTAFVGSLAPGSEIFRNAVSSMEQRGVLEEVLIEMNIYSNPEQLRVMRIVAKHVLDGGKQLMMYVAGVGGTGKSHLIKAIVLLFQKLG
ncbi:hypothetical protein C8R47DRAFT_915332, partial [Mycena vitilis]